MLRDHEEVREKYQERFLHVLVDEFQDTNIAQYQLAKLFAGKHPNICVVGDPGPVDLFVAVGGHPQHPQLRAGLSGREDGAARAELPLDAEHPRRGTRRSSPATSSGKRSRCGRQTGGGEPVVVYEAYDEAEEADFVANEIATLVEEGNRPYGDFAVMYRTNAQSRALEEALIRREGPVRARRRARGSTSGAR